jgi:hypothetical protein
MIRRLLLAPYRLAEPWVRHPNWMIRRPAQVVTLGIATIWLALARDEAKPNASESIDELARQFWSSPKLLEFLNGPAIAKPIVGRICRILVLRLSVVAKLRERVSASDRNFALRLRGPIDQRSLRNLLIWQNHILPSYLRQDENPQVDVALILADRSANEARLFDLFSIALMLERLRSVAVFWDEETALAETSTLMSERELGRWRAAEPANDLDMMPRAIIDQVELHGSHGGIKLLPHGRKYANDYLKLALPGRFIIAVGLREREDGTVEPGDLDFWLAVIESLCARYPRAAFVVLNRLAPSQWREWPVHLRFARHQGLNLQDAMCLVQIADGYLGVLDLFGLAAHSAGRPGVYVPLEDPPPTERGDANAAQVIVASRNRADVERAVKSFRGFADVQGY